MTPAAPANLTATITSIHVSLTWVEVANASEYRVHRNGDYVTTVKVTHYDEDIPDGTYTYEVRAVVDGVEHPVAHAPTPPPDNELTLVWQAVPGASGYLVGRDGTPLATVSTARFTTQQFGCACHYKVVAF